MQNLEALVKLYAETVESSLKGAVDELTEDMTVLADMVWKEKETMNADLMMLKQSLVRAALGEGSYSKVKLLELKAFDGRTPKSWRTSYGMRISILWRRRSKMLRRSMWLPCI